MTQKPLSNSLPPIVNILRGLSGTLLHHCHHNKQLAKALGISAGRISPWMRYKEPIPAPYRLRFLEYFIEVLTPIPALLDDMKREAQRLRDNPELQSPYSPRRARDPLTLLFRPDSPIKNKNDDNIL